MTPPTIGRIVHYRLTETDVARIEQSRGGDSPGNRIAPGFVYPAIVVRTSDDTDAVNLQVFLDGPDTYWVTSRPGSQFVDGCWFWPPRVDMTREGR